MQRSLYNEMTAWKASAHRKPLIIQGARQVGKTWLMKEFGAREYASVLYVNFDHDSWAKQLFVQDYDMNRILLFLQAHTGIKVEAGKTLIILDEIQEAERGLGALKYFCEDAPEQHVVAAGSLLGIAMHQGVSYPVGKVNMLTLHPMTFEEFLLALGEDIKADVLKQHDWELLRSLDVMYQDLLRQYYYVGGMPEAVLSFVAHRDLADVRRIQKEILTAYRNDISKHAPTNDIPRINMVLDSIPAQLAKENKKFIYGAMRPGARAKDFELAIQWLIDAGIVTRVYRAKEPSMPLKFYEDMSAFKLYLCDCGLLGCLAEVPASLVITSNTIFKEYKGAFTESYVLQQLQPLHLPLYYWSSNDSRCEIDFMTQLEDRIVPIEVKAEENVHAQSLNTFCTQKYPGLKGLRCSMLGYIDQGWMTNIPLYAVAAFFGD